MTNLFRAWMRGAQILITSALCAAAQSPMDNQQLAVHISTTASSFAAGAEIDVNVDVTNRSDHKIIIPTGLKAPELGGFEFSVSRLEPPPTAAVPATAYLRAALGAQAPKDGPTEADELVILLSGLAAGTPIPTGATVRFSAVLNDLYDMATPGIYTIQVLRPVPNPGVGVESNTITVAVTDPPPPTISLVVSTTGQQFPLDSEIDADLTVTNISTQPINLPFDPSHPSAERNGFKFSGATVGKSPDGPVLSKIDYWWKEFKYQYPGQQVIQPNQAIHYQVRLCSVLDLSSPGTYAIQAKKIDPVTHLSVKSNVLTIIIQ